MLAKRGRERPNEPMDATRSAATPAALIPPHLSQLLAQLAAIEADDRVGDGAALNLDQPAAAWPREAYSAVIGAVPFSGSVDTQRLAGDFALMRTRRRDLNAVAACLGALQPGGRAALVVPETLLEGATRAHRVLRRCLVEQYDLRAVFALGAGVFKPRVRAAIVLLGKGGTTGSVWFDTLPAVSDVQALVARWQQRARAASDAAGQGFWVPREAIAAGGYALGIERWRAARVAGAPAPMPQQILHEIACLEAEILQGIRDLVGMLK
jgi:type I restriction enzyme M protein